MFTLFSIHLHLSFRTNREAALSQTGIEQIEATCEELKNDGVAPTIVRYSLAASSIDSTNIIGRELKVGRDRLVPEFNYMVRSFYSYAYSNMDTNVPLISVVFHIPLFVLKNLCHLMKNYLGSKSSGELGHVTIEKDTSCSLGDGC